jgi:hypothetical protein
MHLTHGPAAHGRRNRQRASQAGHSHAAIQVWFCHLFQKKVWVISFHIAYSHVPTQNYRSHFLTLARRPARTQALIDMGLLTMYLHLLHPNDFGGAWSARASTSVGHAQIPPNGVWWKVKKGAGFSVNPSLTAWIIINNQPLASDRCHMPLSCY